MVRVEWAPAAVIELLAVESYIGDFNPLAAQRMALRLRAAGEDLVHFPERGRRISRGRRVLAVVSPYLIVYIFRGDLVEILNVRHGARRPLR